MIRLTASLAAALLLVACTAENTPEPVIRAKISGQAGKALVTEAVVENISDRPQTYRVYCTGQGRDGRYEILADTVFVLPKQSTKAIGIADTDGEVVTDIECLTVKPE